MKCFYTVNDVLLCFVLIDDVVLKRVKEHSDEVTYGASVSMF